MISNRYIVGIDEVGRGSLAGPVTVAAVAIPEDLNLSTEWELSREGQIVRYDLELRDSKKLSHKERVAWFDNIKSRPEIFFAVKSVRPKTIDAINIAKAANLAAYRALGVLLKTRVSLANVISIYLDGGLYIKGRKYQLGNFQNAHTIVGGDETISQVSVASIIAKVTRDRYMTRLAKLFPQYGFDSHKGYGTKKHKRAIERHGLSELHRLTFCGRYISMYQSN